MTILIYKNSNVVYQARPDEESYRVIDNAIEFEGLRVLDPPANQLDIVTNVNIPADFEPYKYKYINGQFELNPDY